MISVDQALTNIFEQITQVDRETVALSEAAGRVLADDVYARQDQPPFRTSVMDGYALRSADVAPGAKFRVIGEAAAGHRFSGTVSRGDAVRIFTGAPMPEGADRVVIQEDVTAENDGIVVLDTLDPAPYVRAIGSDFCKGDTVSAPRRLSGADISLFAAMNVPDITVFCRPSVALMATGDELVMPGEEPNEDQIVASNIFGLASLIEEEGGIARILPIARDNDASLTQAFELAQGNDLIVTIGGASVGDHDLVGQVVQQLGMKRAFYKVAMRPGKPLMAGKFGDAALIGLPGNPVSALVCGHLFLRPALRAMQGLPAAPLPRKNAALAASLGANGAREHYMRATLGPEGLLVAASQDSALLSVLAGANALIVRPPNDPEKSTGDTVEYIDL